MLLIIVCLHERYSNKIVDALNIEYKRYKYSNGSYISPETIIILGDSIESEYQGLWPLFLSSSIRFREYKNSALPGACITNYGSGNFSILNNIDKQNVGEYSICLLGGGTNDWLNNVPLGDIYDLDDEMTFAGELNSFIVDFKKKYPRTRLVLMSNCFGISPDRHNFNNDNGVVNSLGLEYADYVKVIRELSLFHGIDYIPIYENCGINDENYSSYLCKEYNSFGDLVFIHPNDAGAELIYKEVLNYMIENIEITNRE